MKKLSKKDEKEQKSLKEKLQEWLQTSTSTPRIPRDNEEKMILGLITSAMNGNSRAFQTINDILNDKNIEGTPEIRVNIVDNTRLEKFIYMNEEQIEQWEREHEGMKEYKITCLDPETREKLELEYQSEE